MVNPVCWYFQKQQGLCMLLFPMALRLFKNLERKTVLTLTPLKMPTYFNDDSLKKYAAVIFLSTTGDVLNNKQEIAFERYIQAGGGYVGVHAATDTEYDWGWYGRLVGAYFYQPS